LVCYPNGAPMLRNGRDRGNSALYQSRQAAKGFEYIGPSLTPSGVKRLAEVIAGERQDYILYLEEEITSAEQTIREADKPEVRDQARTRRGQLTRQQNFYAKPLDIDGMIAELDDMMKAQKLAALSPAQREAFSVMFDEQVSGRVADLVNKMEGKSSTSDGVRVNVTNAGPEDEF